MQTIAKVGIGVGATALVGTGGYFVATSFLNDDSPKPSITPSDNALESPVSPKEPRDPKKFQAFNGSNSSANSTGKLYGKYLLDADSNKDWWTDIYNKYFLVDKDLPVSSAKFSKSVISGDFSTDSNTNTKLNQTCKQVYENDAFLKGDTPQDIKNALSDNEWKAIWKYCSTFDPTFVSVENEGSTIKSKGSGILLSADDEHNQVLWTMKHEEFSKLQEKDIDDQFFKTLLKEEGKQQTLQSKCKAAYEMNEPGANDALDSTKTKLANVLKFCSLKEITNN